MANKRRKTTGTATYNSFQQRVSKYANNVNATSGLEQLHFLHETVFVTSYSMRLIKANL
jgi:hypothetical protein